jgi:hypothetical protein
MRMWVSLAIVMALMMVLSGMSCGPTCYQNYGGCPNGPPYRPPDEDQPVER